MNVLCFYLFLYNTRNGWNACQLWWISQWVYECKKELELTDANERKQKLKSYVDHCIRNKEKKKAGMKHFKNAPSVSE